MSPAAAAKARLAGPSRQTESADLDELFADVAHLRLERTGAARYCLKLEAADGVVTEIDLWTTRKGRIAVAIDADESAAAAEGLRWQFAAADELELLEAPACRCHFERMTRGHCWLGLDVGELPTIHVNLDSRGYLKARRRL